MIDARIGRSHPRDTVRPLGDAAPIDREAVARLRRAIAAGTYQIEPDDVAAAMVNLDLSPLTIEQETK